LSLSIRVLHVSSRPREYKQGKCINNSIRSTNLLPSAFLFPTIVMHSTTITKAAAYISTIRPHLDLHLMRSVADGLSSQPALLVLSHICPIGMPSSARRTRSRHGFGLEMIHLFLQMSALAIKTPKDSFRLRPVNGELRTFVLSIISVTFLSISRKRKLSST
jgi:hypothetical protein